MNMETNQEPRVSRWELGRSRTPRLVLRPRVLLGEGDNDMRYLLRWALRRDGCDVIESRNAEELLDYISTSAVDPDSFGPPDLILVDLDLPGHDPLDVLDAVRGLIRRTPIILIAGEIDERIECEARRLRIEAVFGKPLDIDHVRRLVRATVAV